MRTLQKYRKSLLGAVLVFSGLVVFAVSYGRWLCSDCSIQQNITAGTVATEIAEVYSFLLAEVNKEVSIWKANDTVTICDGSLCLLMLYQANGKHYVSGTPFKDVGGTYKNSSSYAEAGDVSDGSGVDEVSSCTATTTSTWINWSSCGGGSAECESGSTYVDTGVEFEGSC